MLLAEKAFLRYVAINFHRKALAERIAENQLGLRALDRLSNAQPTAKKSPYAGKKGHRSRGSSADMLGANGESEVTRRTNWNRVGKGTSSSLGVAFQDSYSARSVAIVDRWYTDSNDREPGGPVGNYTLLGPHPNVS